MSDFRIIYPNEETGGVVLVCPAPGFTVDQVIKDVPTGKPYLIVDVNDLQDFDFFEAWETDFSNAPIKD